MSILTTLEMTREKCLNISCSMEGVNIEGPKPSHYLARGAERFTPLIPVDELPSHIKIVGVPEYIDHEELLFLKGNACFPIIEKPNHVFRVVVEEPGVRSNLNRENTQGPKPNVSHGAAPPNEASGSPPRHQGGHVNVPDTQTRDVSVALSEYVCLY